MDIESLLRESRAEALAEPLGLLSESGVQQWKAQIRKMTSNIGVLQRRQETILALRNTLDPETQKRMDSYFDMLKTIEPELETFFEKTEVEKNSYEQLLFSGWAPLQPLNTVPFFLLCLAYFKQYLVPLLAVMTPLFMIVVPYVFLRYIYNVPISTDQYIQIVLGMFGLQNLDLSNPRTLLQGGLTLFSISQSIYQPIQNALHLQTIHVQLMKKAECVKSLLEILESVLEILPKPYRFQNPLAQLSGLDLHRQFADLWDHPYKLRLALQVLGDCEVVYRIACLPTLKAVHLLVGASPSFRIHNGTDPFLSESVPFSLSLKGRTHHAVLTGPNRGGKSSVLRSTLLTVVLSQTIGMAFAERVSLRPFDWIATGLKLQDTPGQFSMFESEVDFAIKILQRAMYRPDLIGFVVFDELFHSTNPPDGARTADLFLQKLWKTGNTASFISTHVFHLAKQSPNHIQKLCVPAQIKENGSLHFTYTLQQGICEVSSVDEILKEKGLLTAETLTPENQKQ